MCSEADALLSARGVGKMYRIYSRPVDRLKQTLFAGTRNFYREFWALRGVDLDLGRGESVGIIGRNGSGKSTLLQILAGVLQPTTGRVRVSGRVGALLELGSGFNPEFTGRENVLLQGALLGFSRRQVLDRIDAIADFADIGDFFDQPVKTYSSGMFVRLAFAVHAQMEPDLLIVDEALAVGDEKFQRKCFARLEQLQCRGASILLVTHSTAFIEKYCERAMLLHAGEVHAAGPSKDVINHYHALLYADEEAYLRYRNQQARAAAAPSLPAPEGGVPAAAEVGEPAALTTDRARIEDVWIHDASGCSRELFTAGDAVEIGMVLRINDHVPRVQAGLRVRTVEGVEVFGTSSAYLDRCIAPARPGECYRITFRTRLNLCTGTYFISLAAAEALIDGSMVYLDKRADILMIKVREHPVTASGIARLPVEISIIRAPQPVTLG